MQEVKKQKKAICGRERGRGLGGGVHMSTVATVSVLVAAVFGGSNIEKTCLVIINI